MLVAREDVRSVAERFLAVLSQEGFQLVGDPAKPPFVVQELDREAGRRELTGDVCEAGI